MSEKFEELLQGVSNSSEFDHVESGVGVNTAKGIPVGYVAVCDDEDDPYPYLFRGEGKPGQTEESLLEALAEEALKYLSDRF